MKFEDTGLKENTLVREAFNFAATYTKSLAREMVEQQLNDSYLKQITALDNAQASGQLSEEDYNSKLAKLDQSLEAQKPRIAQVAEQQFNAMFTKDRFASALEIQKHSENATPERLAAAILIDCRRDPVEDKILEEKFGKGVTGPIAEVLHASSVTPLKSGQYLATEASADAKSIQVAEKILGLQQLPAQAKLAEMQGKKLLFPAKVVFEQIKPLWGNDKGLDARLVDAFNKVTDALASPFKIDASDAAAPKLVKSAPVPKKDGPKITGDEGFSI